MGDDRNLLVEGRTARAASCLSDDPEIRTIYLAVAKCLIARATAELRELAAGCEAMERESARVAGLGTQIEIDDREANDPQLIAGARIEGRRT